MSTELYPNSFGQNESDKTANYMVYNEQTTQQPATIQRFKQPKKLRIYSNALIHHIWTIDAFTPTVWAFFPQAKKLPNETQVVSAFQDLMAANRGEPALPVEPWEPALGINKGTRGSRGFS